MQKNFLDIQDLNKEEELLKQISLFFRKVLESTIQFSIEERDSKNILLYDTDAPNEENQQVQNLKLFYQNYDLGIHVDQYDLKVKKQAELLSLILSYKYEFFQKLTERFPDHKEHHKIHCERLKVFIKKLSFRIEKSLNDALFTHNLKNVLKLTQQLKDNDIVQMIFVPFKLMKNNQINIPVMHIYFKQLKNFQSYLDMEQIQENMEICLQTQIKKLKEAIENEQTRKESINHEFQHVKKIIQIQNWLKVLHNKREGNFEDMKKTIDLELFLKEKNLSLSLHSELLLMINKQSNTLFFKYIKNDLLKDVQQRRLQRFFLIYDMLKDKNSICMRERLSREQITDLVEKELQTNKSGNYYYIWLPILLQICRKTKYFFKSKNFTSFSGFFKRQIQRDDQPREMISTIKAFFNPSYVFVKTMRIFLTMYPFSDCLDHYISYFLIDKNYSLKSDIFCFVQPFKSRSQERKFIRKIQRCFDALSHRGEESGEALQVSTFYLSLIAPRYLFYISKEGLVELLAVCRSLKSEEFMNIAKNSSFVALVKFLSLVYQKTDEMIEIDQNIQNIFTYSWNNIAHPKDGDERVKNICIFLVSTLINKRKKKIEELCGKLFKPLFDTVLTETKILDNESKLLWLQSLRLLLQVNDNNERNLFQRVINSHDFNDSNLSSKCWWFLIEMRDFVELDFLDYANLKYFQDPFISLNDCFDSLLIILTLLVKHRESPKVKEYLADDKKQKLISKLMDNYVRETQELINEDKFFNLLLVYLKLFGDVQLNFNDVYKNFLDPSKFKRSHSDNYNKNPKFPKISIMNMQLIQIYLLNSKKDPLKFKEATKKVLPFLPNHKANSDFNCYIKHTEIPIYVFNLMKLCFENKESLQMVVEKLHELIKKFNKQNRDMMIGVYFYHFLIEDIQLFPNFKVINIEKMLDYLLSAIIQDKNKHSFKPNTRHYVKGLFDLKEGYEIEHEYSYLALYKFFAITLLKTLFLTFKYQISPSDYKYLISTVAKIIQKVTFENVMLKHTLLCLVHSLIFPKHPLSGWENFSSTALTLQQKCELVLTLQVPENHIQKECLNPQFKNYINDYFDIILQFMYVYQPLSREFTVFLTNQVFDLFIFLDETKKDLFVERLGSSVNYDLFSIFNFFLLNWEPDRMSALVLHKEGNDILGTLVIYFMHVLKRRCPQTSFVFGDTTLATSQKSFSLFLGFIECKGFNNQLSREFVEKLFRQKFMESSPAEIEKFIVLLLDTLRNDSNLLQYDYIEIIKILLSLSGIFVESDLLLKALMKNERKQELMHSLNLQKPGEKQALLIQSIFKHNLDNPLADFEYPLSQKQQDLMANVSINRKLRNFDSILTDIEQYLKGNESESEGNNFDVKQLIFEQYLSENWIEANKNLSQWETLDQVSKDTENFELKIQSAKITNNVPKKLLLVQSDCRSMNESQGIVDLVTTLLDNIDIQNNQPTKNNQKDLLFVYNFFHQNENNLLISFDNLKRVVLNHQLTNEFQICYDILQKNSSVNNAHKDIELLINEWAKKLPSHEREPFESIQILSQRIYLSEKIYHIVNHSQEENPSIHYLKISLLSKLQLLKIQRLHSIPETFNLNSISYSESSLSTLPFQTLYKLYKENSYRDLRNNVESINLVVQNIQSRLLSNKFLVFDLKQAVDKNELNKGFQIARKIVAQPEQIIGKYYEIFFELLYQFILQSNLYKKEFLIDLFDAFTKALIYDYSKNSCILFYKFFLVNYLFPPPEINETPIQNSENPILGDIIGDFQKQINQYLQHIPLKVFKPHLLEIIQSAFRFHDDRDQDKNIFHKIFIRLWNHNPFDINYSIENLMMNLESPVFNELHSKLFSNYKLMQKGLFFKTLGDLVEKYTKEHSLKTFVLMKQIIEDFYAKGKVDESKTAQLFELEPQIKVKFLEIQNKNTSPLNKIFEVIVFFEEFIAQSKIQSAIFVPEFLSFNEIYLIDFKQAQLQFQQDYSRKRFVVQPYFFVELIEGHVNLVLKLTDETKRVKKIRIKPFNPQRRNEEIKNNKKINSIFTLHQRVLTIFLELFFKDPLTRNITPSVSQNFVKLSNEWYLVDDSPSLVLEKVINQHYPNHDFKDIHKPFYLQKTQHDKVFEIMKKEYPKTVFRDYLIKNMNIPEQYQYFTQKFAGSVAYESFLRHVFGFSINFNDALVNLVDGHFYYDIISDLFTSGNPFSPRLTPNFQTILPTNVINNDFLPVLIQMGKILREEKNQVYLLYTVMLLDQNIQKTQSFEQIQKQAENVLMFIKNFDNQCIYAKFMELKENDFLVDSYALVDKPWF